MAKNIDCRCEYNFTCCYCLSNAKPWLFIGFEAERKRVLDTHTSKPLSDTKPTA